VPETAGDTPPALPVLRTLPVPVALVKVVVPSRFDAVAPAIVVETFDRVE
jgi:hypothetical protein